MKIKITGASGYLGSILSLAMTKNGHIVSGVGRDILYGPENLLAEEIENIDALIHLAGAPILRRWTKKNKQEIIDSRVITTLNIIRAIRLLKPDERPHKVISASGISIYSPGKIHTENSMDFDTGFLGEVVKKWEDPWKLLPSNIELTIFRMAPVLGRNSATIQKMKLPFKMGVGGKIGNGKQPFPFIHEKDVARAYIWAVDKPERSGTYILASPHQINNKEFTSAMASKLHRPAFTMVPGFALQLLYGEASEMLTNSPAVYPEKLLNKGFQFNFNTIQQTLHQIFQ